MYKWISLEKQRNEVVKMAKKKNQKSNKKPPVTKVSIQELQESRDGGQIALRGYSYQFLYSCNLILSSGTDTIFTLEGIEDIDTIKCSDLEIMSKIVYNTFVINDKSNLASCQVQ